MDPSFLELEQVLLLHDRSLTSFGGSPGIRDLDLLEGAVMQARQDYYYGNADDYGIAAAYAFHIAEAQSFLDGNKRTAIASALAYLEMQGIDTTCDWTIPYNAMIAIAEKKLDKEGLAQTLRALFSEEG